MVIIQPALNAYGHTKQISASTTMGAVRRALKLCASESFGSRRKFNVCGKSGAILQWVAQEAERTACFSWTRTQLSLLRPVLEVRAHLASSTLWTSAPMHSDLAPSQLQALTSNVLRRAYQIHQHLHLLPSLLNPCLSMSLQTSTRAEYSGTALLDHVTAIKLADSNNQEKDLVLRLVYLDTVQTIPLCSKRRHMDHRIRLRSTKVTPGLPVQIH